MSDPSIHPMPTEQTNDVLDEIGAEIENTDHVAFSIQLTRLVDGERTYECRVDGHPMQEFASYEEASDFVAGIRRKSQAQAALGAVARLGKRSEAVTDEVADFATWLTTREKVIEVGASETVYAMFAAFEEWRRLHPLPAPPAALNGGDTNA